MEPEPLKSGKTRKVEVTVTRSINPVYHAVVVFSFALRRLLTFNLTFFGIPSRIVAIAKIRLSRLAGFPCTSYPTRGMRETDVAVGRVAGPFWGPSF